MEFVYNQSINQNTFTIYVANNTVHSAVVLYSALLAAYHSSFTEVISHTHMLEEIY